MHDSASVCEHTSHQRLYPHSCGGGGVEGTDGDFLVAASVTGGGERNVGTSSLKGGC